MESLCRLKGLRDFLWDVKRFLKALLRFKLVEMCLLEDVWHLLKSLWRWLQDVLRYLQALSRLLQALCYLPDVLHFGCYSCPEAFFQRDS